MKVLVCFERGCSDLFKLDYEVRSCKCGLVTGKYNDNGDTVTWNGQGAMFGIDNYDLVGLREEVRMVKYPTDNGKITIDRELV